MNKTIRGTIFTLTIMILGVIFIIPTVYTIDSLLDDFKNNILGSNAN